MISNSQLVVAIAAISCGLVFTIPSTIDYAHGDNINHGVFAIDSQPYGKPYAEWAGKWNQWLISVPQPLNPATDHTGNNCGQNQAGPVWFLAGTTGGSAERTCIIPSGKAILFPIISSGCDYAAYPNVKSEQALVSCARADDDRATNLQATVDGVPLKQLDKYRATSPLSSITFPPHNLFGSPPGKTQGIADGFWVFLQPLSPGKHELHFSGVTPGNPTTGTANFAIDTKYHLIVH
ncbi:MAG: hypothetical protein WA395_00555 [Nitrososphaeraceae archaeon]